MDNLRRFLLKEEEARLQRAFQHQVEEFRATRRAVEEYARSAHVDKEDRRRLFVAMSRWEEDEKELRRLFEKTMRDSSTRSPKWGAYLPLFAALIAAAGGLALGGALFFPDSLGPLGWSPGLVLGLSVSLLFASVLTLLINSLTNIAINRALMAFAGHPFETGHPEVDDRIKAHLSDVRIRSPRLTNVSIGVPHLSDVGIGEDPSETDERAE